MPTPWDRASASGSFLPPQVETGLWEEKNNRGERHCPSKESGQGAGRWPHLWGLFPPQHWPRLDFGVWVPGPLLVQKGLPEVGRPTCPHSQEAETPGWPWGIGEHSTPSGAATTQGAT